MESTENERVDSELVNVLKLYTKSSETAIELVEPIEDNITIKKFLNKNKQGIHHIALTVDNIFNAISFLQYNKITLVYNKPRKGSNNKLITFIHPSSSTGILIELCQNQ